MSGADVCHKQQKHNPNNKIYESISLQSRPAL